MARITRRELILGSASAAALYGQAKYPGVDYRDYARILPDHLRKLAHAAYQRRNAEIAKLTTPGQISKRTQFVRRTFWDLVGGEPERTPLKERTAGSFARSGYRLDKVLYQSRPEFYIPANLYVPTAGSGPFPGVLFQMGHSLNGKANVTYQKCCQGLARLGYVVLAFDPMGQGERTYYPGAGGVTRLGSADDEHTYPGKQMLLVGDTATRLQVWDAVRSLDYLASRPEVDPKRLASTGQSGGATLTMLLACVDDRLAAAAVSSGNTENFACADFNPPGSTDDAEQDLVGSCEAGVDRFDLLYPLAPKPLLILASAHDFFGTYSPSYLSSGWEEYRKLQRVYTVLGHPDRLAWADTPLPHGLSYYPRLRIYNWFERWLKGSSKPIEREPDVAPEADPDLWVGATGNVVRDFQSAKPFTLIQARAATLRPGPPDPARVRKLLGMPVTSSGGPVRKLATVPSGDLTLQAIEIQSEAGVWLPAWLWTPKVTDPAKGVTLVFDERGRNQHWHEGGLGEQLAKSGGLACIADIRGIGDLKPEVGRGAPGYSIPHEQEEDYAWASLILGHSLLGQRVTDILAFAGALKHYGPVNVTAIGRLTVPALIAGFLSKDIASLHLKNGLASLKSVVENETYHCPLANIVPGLLAHTDLPQLVEALRPRPVILETV